MEVCIRNGNHSRTKLAHKGKKEPRHSIAVARQESDVHDWPSQTSSVFTSHIALLCVLAEIVTEMRRVRQYRKRLRQLFRPLAQIYAN